MPKRAIRLLLASTIALYAATIVCGPALHSHPAASFETEGRLGTAELGSPSHDGCPACHFLSQAQLAPDPAAGACADVVVEMAAGAPEAPTPPSPGRPSRPRAPPLA